MRGGLFEGSGLTQDPLHVVALEIGKRSLVAFQTETGHTDSFRLAPTGAASTSRRRGASAVRRQHHKPSFLVPPFRGRRGAAPGAKQAPVLTGGSPRRKELDTRLAVPHLPCISSRARYRRQRWRSRTVSDRSNGNAVQPKLEKYPNQGWTRNRRVPKDREAPKPSQETAEWGAAHRAGVAACTLLTCVNERLRRPRLTYGRQSRRAARVNPATADMGRSIVRCGVALSLPTIWPGTLFPGEPALMRWLPLTGAAVVLDCYSCGRCDITSPIRMLGDHG